MTIITKQFNRIRRRRRRSSSKLPEVTFSFVAAILMSSLLGAMLITPAVAQQSQDPQTLNGGSILAMAGDGCVAVAVDKRFGSGPQTVNVAPRLVMAPHSCLLVAFTGLEGDVRSLAEEISVQISSKMGRYSGFGFGGSGVDAGRAIPLRSMAALTSHILYSRRRSPYYVEPIVAGLERVIVEDEGDVRVSKNGSISTGRKRMVAYRPFLCSHDLIGAQSKSDCFVCSGAASKSLYGTAQAMWQPGLKPEELARVCGRAFLSALERDCLSGYGAVVYVITGDRGGEKGEGGSIVEYDLACRND